MESVKNNSLRHRVFNVVFLVGIFMSFSSSLVNYFLGLGTALVLITFACGAITVALYIVFKISGNFDLVALIIVICLSFVFFQPCGLLTGERMVAYPIS